MFNERNVVLKKRSLGDLRNLPELTPFLFSLLTLKVVEENAFKNSDTWLLSSIWNSTEVWKMALERRLHDHLSRKGVIR